MPDSSFFQIPGNIKQQCLPFVLNPGSKLNSQATTSRELTGVGPQRFTYKTSDTKDLGSGIGRIQFYPSSLDKVAINDDISLKLLYGRDSNSGKVLNKSVTISDILDQIPGIQIREFLPDTRLDQTINQFLDLFSNMAKIFTNDEDSKTKTAQDQQKPKEVASDANIFEKIITASRYTVKYMVGAITPNFFTDMGTIEGVDFSTYNNSFWQSAGSSNKTGYYVMTFPYALYYKMQTCVTTNLYQIPAVISDKRILNAGEGMAGWTSGGDYLRGFRLSGLLGKIPVVGDLANMVLGNIGINYMPWWNADPGTKTKEPQIELTFDLFNDSDEAAMMNFIFVNTLVPNNKWVQYNMFQHSQCIYDVKVEGISRLFACAGNFDVTYNGVLRDPPAEWVSVLTAKYCNTNVMSAAMRSKILQDKLIKIPDVYHVKMQFQSLMPANLNNYIYQYAQNNNQVTQYSKKLYEQSTMSTALPNAISKYSKRIVQVWKSNSEAAGGGAA